MMPDIGPSHPLTYRQEIAAPLFDLLRSGESVAVVGPASMGKSRLLQFLLRPDVQQHYLGEAAASTWLVLADCNRLVEVSEWGLYELLLTSLTEDTSGRLDAAQREWLNGLRREAITAGNALLARRHVELAARILCREHGLRLCFIFDEFDEIYRALPAPALANLRALRDAELRPDGARPSGPPALARRRRGLLRADVALGDWAEAVPGGGRPAGDRSDRHAPSPRRHGQPGGGYAGAQRRAPGAAGGLV